MFTRLKLIQQVNDACKVNQKAVMRDVSIGYIKENEHNFANEALAE